MIPFKNSDRVPRKGKVDAASTPPDTTEETMTSTFSSDGVACLMLNQGRGEVDKTKHNGIELFIR